MFRLWNRVLSSQNRSCGVWVARWNEDGTRSVKRDHMILKEEWKGGRLVYRDVNGIAIRDPPTNIESSWTVGKVVVEKGSGDIWDRTPSGRYISRTTGFEESRPHPRNTRSCYYLPVTSNDGTFDEYRIRIEKGPIMEYCEKIRDFLCNNMNKKYSSLIHPPKRVNDLLGITSELVSTKVTQVNNLLTSNDEDDAENAAISLIHLLNIISSKTASVDSSKVIRRTHIMTLPYNPLSGLYPLFDCNQSSDFLSKVVTSFSGYEDFRGASTVHKQFSTLSESLLGSYIAQRRALRDPFYSSQNRSNLEKAGMLQACSQTHNYFLFWSTMLPGGCKLGLPSNSEFVEVVINGVFGSFDHFCNELQEKAASIETGWLWLAVDVTRTKKISQGIKRFQSGEEKKKVEPNTEARDIVMREKVDIVLGDVTETLTGRVVGYDFQIICTQDNESPVAHGYYPLTCLPISAQLVTSTRSKYQYVKDWLKVINWKVVDFQLRTCFKSIVKTSYSDHFPQTSSPHAVWIDLVQKQSEDKKFHRVTEYKKAKDQIHDLVESTAPTKELDDWFTNEHVELKLDTAGEVATEKIVIKKKEMEIPKPPPRPRATTIEDNDIDIIDDELEDEDVSSAYVDFETAGELNEKKEHIGNLPPRSEIKKELPDSEMQIDEPPTSPTSPTSSRPKRSATPPPPDQPEEGIRKGPSAPGSVEPPPRKRAGIIEVIPPRSKKSQQQQPPSPPPMQTLPDPPVQAPPSPPLQKPYPAVQPPPDPPVGKCHPFPPERHSSPAGRSQPPPGPDRDVLKELVNTNRMPTRRPIRKDDTPPKSSPTRSHNDVARHSPPSGSRRQLLNIEPPIEPPPSRPTNVPPPPDQGTRRSKYIPPVADTPSEVFDNFINGKTAEQQLHHYQGSFTKRDWESRCAS
eukprot:TRINITY_DN559_c3_g1_i2.p1 TRINITY_DN559_c3_g1~~TRINITY_DN559_c3_g1_i2.p1  ORF type:complete len:910 (+),score=159.04 TRINITY_DN559_c3_g1_i2:36-2765(+)